MNGGKIRNQLRAERRSLSPDKKCQNSDQITSILTKQAFFLRAKRVGIYLANDGEIDPSPIVDICLKSAKNCYMPVLHPLKIKRLHFAQYHHQTNLVANHYGISEPNLKNSKLAPAWSLDIILMPLVGFDRQGNRMGMGAGYYDRSLGFMVSGKSPAPTLVGLAHSFQELSSIARQYWDIPLNYIITEREIICAKPK